MKDAVFGIRYNSVNLIRKTDNVQSLYRSLIEEKFIEDFLLGIPMQDTLTTLESVYEFNPIITPELLLDIGLFVETNLDVPSHVMDLTINREYNINLGAFDRYSLHIMLTPKQ